MTRICPGCRRPLAYGSKQIYHGLACRRMDNRLARMAADLGITPRALLASLLTEHDGIMGAAVRLGVDHHTVVRWVRRYGVRRVWGDGVVYVQATRRTRKVVAESPAQLRLL